MPISKQKIHLGLRLSIALALLGILFKIMHWPFPGVILFVGVTGIVIFYSIQFSQKQSKTLLDYSKLALLISFLIYYLLQVLHLPYSYFFRIATQISLAVFIIFYLRHVLFLKGSEDENLSKNAKKRSLQKKLSYLLYGIAAVGIIIGSQFKILHWEFKFISGDILLTIGLIAATAGVLLGINNANS